MTLTQYCCGLVLVGIRVSGLFVFAPFFSSSAIPVRVKAMLALCFTLAAGPALVGSQRGPGLQLGIGNVLGECGVSLVYGLALSFLTEIANTTGQLVGMQTSFTLVNLLDPNSHIENTLFSEMFQMFTVTVLISSGFDHLILMSLLRTFSVVPPGAATLSGSALPQLLPIASGVWLAALQLVAPLLAATTLVEVSIALMSKLSPQLPVVALTVPMKTIVSLLVLISCLSFWSGFLEHQCAHLLDVAQAAVVRSVRGPDRTGAQLDLAPAGQTALESREGIR